MKKLLIITDMFPNKYNHVSGIFVKHQVDELAKHYQVNVVATSFSHRLEFDKLVLDNYQVNHVYFPILRFAFLSSLFAYRCFAIPIIRRIVKEWKPEIIHVHDCRHVPELVNLAPALKRTKVPAFLTVHNIRTHPNMLVNNYLILFYRISLNRAYGHWEKVFVVNDNLKNVLSKHINKDRIIVIGNAVNHIHEIDINDLKQFTLKLSSQAFKIISVGNLKAEKGFNLLIEAVQRIIASGVKIQLMIVGDGEERDRLYQMIEDYGLSKEVMLVGSLDNNIVRNLYQFFDLFVLPSYSETFGIVYIEAMYAGLPVIGIKGQGIDGIVCHGENGLLAKPNSVESLINEIDFMLNNKETAMKMAERGMTLVKVEFILEDLIKKVMEHYGK